MDSIETCITCKQPVRPRQHGIQCDGWALESQNHNHQPAVGAATAAKIMASVKEKAAADLFKPASAICDRCFGSVIHLLFDEHLSSQ